MLACLLIPQGIFLQSLVITDTRLLQKFSYEKSIRNGFLRKPRRGEAHGWAKQLNILRNHDANL